MPFADDCIQAGSRVNQIDHFVAPAATGDEPEGSTFDINIQINDRCGGPADLSWLSPTSSSSSSSSLESMISSSSSSSSIVAVDEDFSGLRFIVKEMNHFCRANIDVEGTVIDAEAGQFTVPIPSECLRLYPGIYVAQSILIREGVTQRVIPAYFEVPPNFAGDCQWQNQVITPAEIRMALRDECPSDNFLLDELEFTDAEIMWAIRRPIDEWNETPPPVYNNMTPMTFPYRYHWVGAVIGELYLSAAAHYRRNRLPYNAAGMAVDDKNKSNEYETIGQNRRQEWVQWMKHKKIELNVAPGFKTLRSDFPGYVRTTRYVRGVTSPS